MNYDIMAELLAEGFKREQLIEEDWEALKKELTNLYVAGKITERQISTRLNKAGMGSLSKNAAYKIAKNNLNSAFSPFIQHPFSARTLNQRYGVQKNPRAVLINRSLGYFQRGFVSEKHNVLPESHQHDSKVENNEKQVEGKSPSWRERLQKKVFEKSKKINTIETKGNLYMIYGYILKFNDDGEYYSNYAA